MDMFCRQCEQTAKGTGCQIAGVCGKSSDVAALLDTLNYNIIGIAILANEARALNIRDKEVDLFVIDSLFSLVTNVNFDVKRIYELITKSQKIKEKIQKLLPKGGQKVNWIELDTLEKLVENGKKLQFILHLDTNEDIRSLKEIILYGLRGVAAYAHHAYILEKTNEEVYAFIHKALASLAKTNATADEMTALVLECGKVNLSCLETLDSANTGRFGNPVPTQVFLGQKKGPCIAVSGHDLLDLEEILKQSEGKGISVYTHGEMLPCHGYPQLKKYKHFVGHYGTAWQNQQIEFDAFPGAILMTTNCIQKPRDTYKDHIFTTGLVAFPGVVHIPNINGKKDFSSVIKKALELGGFKADKEGKSITVGFGHNTVLSVAPTVIQAVKDKKIRHFFLIGGCDGAKMGRSYYTEFAQKVPQDCIILTLACGKFRFNTLEFGTIGELPRLLDIGQCNDAYSAVKIAVALAGAFNCTVNDLPLSLILSWYEQKAVCILLTLLHLGIKNIKIGPSLPAFITPNVLNVLVKTFNIQPIKTADEDLKELLG